MGGRHQGTHNGASGSRQSIPIPNPAADADPEANNASKLYCKSFTWRCLYCDSSRLSFLHRLFDASGYAVVAGKVGNEQNRNWKGGEGKMV